MKQNNPYQISASLKSNYPAYVYRRPWTVNILYSLAEIICQKQIVIKPKLNKIID